MRKKKRRLMQAQLNIEEYFDFEEYFEVAGYQYNNERREEILGELKSLLPNQIEYELNNRWIFGYLFGAPDARE